MALITFSAIFAFVFGTIAYRSLPYGWVLAKLGWQVFRATAHKPDARTNSERRRLLEDGNRFLLAGLGWLAVGTVSAILAVISAALMIYFLRIL